jgi:hypothetical protein
MKLSGRAEKWGSVVLGVVCLVLLKLVFGTGVRAGATRPTAPTPASSDAQHNPTGAPRNVKDISRDDPEVRLDLLKEFESRPLLELSRNPFEFVRPPAELVKTQAIAAAPVQPPPPPPPLALKAVGYGEKPGGLREAYVSEEEQIYVVHIGESFAQERFKVLNITPQQIEIEDVASHRQVQIPFPQ